MALVKKTIELDQEAITRIKTALNAKSEKEAINFFLSLYAKYDDEKKITNERTVNSVMPKLLKAYSRGPGSDLRRGRRLSNRVGGNGGRCRRRGLCSLCRIVDDRREHL